jgi:hypothetical protein
MNQIPPRPHESGSVEDQAKALARAMGEDWASMNDLKREAFRGIIVRAGAIGREAAKLVRVQGYIDYCWQRNIKPDARLVLDAVEGTVEAFPSDPLEAR